MRFVAKHSKDIIIVLLATAALISFAFAQEPEMTERVEFDPSTGVLMLYSNDRIIKLGRVRQDGQMVLQPTATGHDFALSVLIMLKGTYGDEWGAMVENLPE